MLAPTCDDHPTRKSAGDAQGGILRVLLFLNWLAFGIGASSTLLWGVVCLMMLPYPELVEQGGMDRILTVTGVLGAFSVVAGLATWLLVRRHALRWAGQAALAAALVAMLLLAWPLL